MALFSSVMLCRDPDRATAPRVLKTFQHPRDEITYLDYDRPEGNGRAAGVGVPEDALRMIDNALICSEEWTMNEARGGAVARRRRARRSFGISNALFGAALLVCGAQLSRGDEALAVVGLVCVAYGIGLLVAGVWLALGRNPLDRRSR